MHASVPYYGPTVIKWATRLEDDTISVAASDTLAPHFSQRRKLLRFSSRYEGFDYVILLRTYVQNDWFDQKDSMSAYNSLIQDPRYLKVDEDGDLEVYKRVK
ncbi:MAG: hypothetical protein UZ21_OP11001000438 [Microgenomates bacterium OLB22]|nr:MAG: hypothetical protein UZ21_OP11001000438 [Microgenomates bacterium OLB22]